MVVVGVLVISAFSVWPTVGTLVISACSVGVAVGILVVSDGSPLTFISQASVKPVDETL